MKIIISRTDKIGDLVLSIPSFFMVRKMFPKAEIMVLVRAYNYDIVKNLPYINKVVKIDDFTETELTDKIQAFKPDYFIALYTNKFISKLARKSKAKYRVGPLSKPHSFFGFNKGVFQKRSKSEKNEAEYNLDLITKIDPELFDKNYEVNSTIYLGEENLEYASKISQELGVTKPYIIVHPFMGGSAKNISQEQYIDLIWELHLQNRAYDIVVSAATSDENECLEIVRACQSPKIKAFVNHGSILNLAAIINNASVFIGGSTGPTHIAGSLKTPVVALYPNKPTQSPTRWGVFNTEKAIHIVPDKNNPKEDYNNILFESYTDNTKHEVLDGVKSFLN